MLISDSYNVYIAEIIKLVRSFTLKSLQTIEAMNLFLTAAGDVISQDPADWKYYRNLAGLPYVGITHAGLISTYSDPSDITVYSLDSDTTIPFTVLTLKEHPITLADFRTLGDAYQKLLARYPDQELLIRGVLNPVDIYRAITADDYTLLNYNAAYIGEGETTLINDIQAWINNYTARWDVKAFAVSDSLYSAANLAILYVNLVMAIVNIRFQNCKTEQVHEFHLWNYLSNYFDLDKYKGVIPYQQALFLYRNLDYITHHAGKKSTLDFLNARFANDFGLELYKHDIRQDIGDSLTALDANLLTDITSSVSVNKYEYSTSNQITADSVFISPEKLVAKIKSQALLNPQNVNHDIAELIDAVKHTASAEIPTGVIECEIIKNTSVKLVSPVQEKIHNWFYLASMGHVKYKVKLSLPTEGIEAITLSATDAAVLLMYAAAKYSGKEVTTIFKPLARDILSDFLDIRELTDRQIAGKIEQRFATGTIPYPTVDEALGFLQWDRITDVKGTVKYDTDDQLLPVDIYSLQEFMSYVDKRIAVKIQHILLPGLERRTLGKSEIKDLIKSFYMNHECLFVEETTFAAFFDRLGITQEQYENFTDSGLLEIIDLVSNAFIGIVPETLTLQHPYSDMVEILRTVSSYMVAFIEGHPTNNIDPIDWAYSNPSIEKIDIDKGLSIIKDDLSGSLTVTEKVERIEVDLSMDITQTRVVNLTVIDENPTEITCGIHHTFYCTLLNIGIQFTNVRIIDLPVVTLPTINITSSISVTEGDSGITAVSIPVTLSTTSTDTVTVLYETAVGGTADGELDFISSSGTVTFTPGTLTSSIEMSVLGELIIENDEIFSIVLSSPVNAVLGTSSCTVTIANDDTALTLVSSTPTSSSTNVNISTDIVLTFNKPIQRGTNNGGWFTISDNTGAGADSMSLNINNSETTIVNNVLTITPPRAFRNNNTYILMLNHTIIGLDNRQYDTFNDIVFTTAEAVVTVPADYYLYLAGNNTDNTIKMLDSSTHNWRYLQYESEVPGTFYDFAPNADGSVFTVGSGSLKVFGNNSVEYIAADMNPLFARSAWSMEFYVMDTSSSTNVSTFNILKGTNKIFSLLVGISGSDPVKISLFNTDTGWTLDKNTWGYFQLIKTAANTYELYKDTVLLTTVTNAIDLTALDNFIIKGGNYSAGIVYLDEFKLIELPEPIVPVISGFAYGVGASSFGQLANSGNLTTFTLMIGLPNNVKVIDADMGYTHTVLIGDDGIPYGLGYDLYGQTTAGNGSTANPIPFPMIGLPLGITAVKCCCGEFFSIVIGSDGIPYGTGQSTGNATWALTVDYNPSSLTPMIGLPAGVQAIDCDAGIDHSVILGSDGIPYGSGLNGSRQLTGTSSPIMSLTPLLGLPVGVKAIKVRAGWHQTVVIGDDGIEYGTGYNALRALTGGSTANLVYLTPFNGMPSDVKVIDCDTGNYHSITLGDNGVPYFCGYNGYGQAGNGTVSATIRVTTLTPMQGLPAGVKAIAVRCGYHFNLVVGDDGIVYGCGKGVVNGLITGDSYYLIPMSGLPPIKDLIRLTTSTGANQSAIVVCTERVIIPPVQLSFTALTASPALWKSISGSANFTDLCAVTDGGTLYTSNDSGVSWLSKSDAMRWTYCDVSPDGMKMMAVNNGLISSVTGGMTSHSVYTSTDAGISWTFLNVGGFNHLSCALSADGLYMATATDVNGIRFSINAGGMFSADGYNFPNFGLPTTANWRCLDLTDSGINAIAISDGGGIFSTPDGGLTWEAKNGDGAWLATDATGNFTLLTNPTTGNFISLDFGVTWTHIASMGTLGGTKCKVNSNGSCGAIIGTDGYIYYSNDSCVTWIKQTDIGMKQWTDIDLSADGTRLAAVESNGYIYMAAI